MARNFQEALASIPGLGGYLAAQQNDQSMLSGQINQVSAVQGLLKSQEEMRQRMLASQREQEFRAGLQALGPNPSQEALAGLAAKFSSPDKLLQSQQSSLDRQAQIGATREAALARLTETARMNDARMDHMIAQTQDQATRTQLMQRQLEMRNFYNARAQALGEAKLFYETGQTIPPGTPPQPAPTPMQSGPLSTVQGEFGGVGVNLQGVSPAALAAVRATPEAQANPDLLAAIGGAPAAPVGVPRPAPSPTPQPPAGAAPSGPVAAPAAPRSPEAYRGQSRPTLADAPAELPMRAKQEWLKQADLAWTKQQGKTTQEVKPEVVRQLSGALDKAGLPEGDAVLKAVEVALQNTPKLASFLAGPYRAVPDFGVGMVATNQQEADAIRAGRQAYQKLFNITLKNRSGAAVTTPEFERLKAEFANGVWKTPEQVISGVTQARNIIQQHYAAIAAGFGPEAVNAYNRNLKVLGGRVVIEPSAPEAPSTPDLPPLPPGFKLDR